MEFAPNTPVAKIVSMKPSRAVVFQKLGIDYCCHGHHSLEQACTDQSLSMDAVIGDLRQHDTAHSEAQETDWGSKSLGHMIDHIVSTHHHYLRRVMPELAAMTMKISHVHGANHPELVEVAKIYQHMHAELEAHMMKEEMILFPMIKQQERDGLSGAAAMQISGPLRVMLAEHDSAGLALEAMRELTNDYSAPEDACNTYRGTMEGLRELEADLHTHIHIENNILFPRAFGSAEQYEHLRAAVQVM